MNIAIQQLRRYSMVKVMPLLMVTALLLPFLIHLIPTQSGIPIGAYLLPMFYVPFLALVLYRFNAALIIALLAPLANFLLTGNPNWGFLAILTLEVVVFTLFAWKILNSRFGWFAAPMAIIGAKIVSTCLLWIVPLLETAPITYFVSSVSNGVTGIMILLLLNLAVIRFYKKTT
ncbi:hypothetical protein [Pleomorphovibrio marinus]|uniref:hypothetical protein n=1 Tax=Pleomorphovibrio marinus TaxID=2164132 RepID=UPI001300418F|nr:hypothetical protein [Pleomorphovibrio marinus]